MNFSEEDVRRLVTEILVVEFELEEAAIVPEATLFDDLGLDSLDAVDMVVALEKKFGMKLHDESAIRSVRTVDDLLKLLIRLGNAP